MVQPHWVGSEAVLNFTTYGMVIFGPCPDLPNEAAHIQTNYGSLSPTYRRSQHVNMNFQLQSTLSSALGKCRSLSVNPTNQKQEKIDDL